MPRLRAALRWAPGFDRHPAESRIFFEPGAKASADRLAAALPEAVRRVETLHARPFPKPFRVYLCASHESFTNRVGLPSASRVRGLALARDVWISPLAFDFRGRDTHLESLAHELAHLHVAQHLGWLRRVRTLPTWFSEGLADRASGTGFEIIPRREALALLVSGPSFEPDRTGRWLVPRGPEDYGVPPALLHAQSRLFVESLEATDPRAFRRLVAGVLDGLPFATAVRDAYGRPLDAIWRGFLVGLPDP